ncbi:aminotransferase class I/II-fold pyridoxal phosphate-dependent enzyme [bacterium]|nr:aminotransferase class I/II-fold pyridoxal phosphate-dependent enzyme [bacterium]
MNNYLLSSIKPFYVMEILEKAQEYEKKGRKITHLEIGEPTQKVSSIIKKTAKNSIEKGYDRYSNSLGVLELRQMVAKKYKENLDVKISPDQVIVTTGSSAALILALISLIKRGDQVVIVEPYYPCYPQLIKIFGGKVRVFKTHERDGYQIDTIKLKKFLSKKDKVLILNSPSNPTGVSQNKEVLSFLSFLGINIISDEIYQGLNYDLDAETILQHDDKAIVVNGFSKFYSMTGWRLGYLVVPKGMIRGIQKLQQNMYICAPTISQHAAIGALQIDNNEIRNMLKSYKKRRDLTIKSLSNMGIDIGYSPDSSFYVFANMSKYTDNSLDLSLDILNKVSLGVAPGLDFGPSFKRYIRFSYSSSYRNIQIGLDKMREYIKGYTE